MTLRSPLSRARGLGSAKEGVAHHWAIIVTAVGLVPLSLWFVISVIGFAHGDYLALKGWFGRPGNSTLMLLTVLTVIYHAHLGVQVVIEDYVQCEKAKLASLVATKLVAALLAVFLTVSILKIAVGV
jgi:succinate dehydrogenase / fumarate reductase membrane anchor subunit